MRYNIGDEDIELFNENRKPNNAVLNAATERSSLANFQIMPPKQAEIFGSPTECYSITKFLSNMSKILSGHRNSKYNAAVQRENGLAEC